ncbi:MAG: phosphoribosyltransferase family protein [Flavobacteriaceae bacterium]
MFIDRTDAGIRLSKELSKYEDQDVVVVAIPRGGLPVAEKVAKSLGAPLEVALVKKLGHPVNKEYAIGAVSLKNLVVSETADISKKYIELETDRIRGILKKRHDQYYRTHAPESIEGKTVIIIDDGIATGNTVMATAELAQTQHPAKLVVAIPVAPISAVQKFKESPLVDEVVCLATPPNFQAVGQFYRYFSQVSDDEAISIMDRYHNEWPGNS